jgi:hypothetical protein
MVTYCQKSSSTAVTICNDSTEEFSETECDPYDPSGRKDFFVLLQNFLMIDIFVGIHEGWFHCGILN